MKFSEELVGKDIEVIRYPVKYPRSAYTYPKGARIFSAETDDEFIHFEFMDGRRLSVPLLWIPTLYSAPPEEREKFVVSEDLLTLIWDPENCAIDEELRVADYLT